MSSDRQLNYVNNLQNRDQNLYYVDDASELNSINLEQNDKIYAINDNKLFQMEVVDQEEELSGSIVSFNGRNNTKIKSLVANIEPQQDLHGQANPYPAGGGKNLSTAVASGSSTDVGVTFNYSGNTISVSGTASGANAEAKISINPVVLKANTVYAFGVGQRGIIKNIRISGTAYAPNSSGYFTLTFTEDTTINEFFFRLSSVSGDTVNASWNWQLEEGSVATAWSPYENECQITGFTGLTVSQANKNLFPMPSPVNGLGTNTMTLTGEVTLLPGTYTVYVSRSDTNNDSVWAIRMSKNGGSYARMGSNLSATALLASRAFTLTETTVCKYQFYSSYSLPTTTQYGVTVVKSGETATEFIPYQGETTPVSWQTEAGTVYGGSLDVTTGVLTVDTVKAVADGTQSSMQENTHSISFLDKFPEAAGYLPTDTQLKCNRLKPSAYTSDYDVIYFNNGRIVTLRFSEEVSNWNSFLASNPVEFTYKVANPVTIQLDPITISTLYGQNNIWADTGDVTIKIAEKGITAFELKPHI